MEFSASQAIASFIVNAVLAVLVGTLSARLWVHAEAPWQADVHARLSRILTGSLALCLAAVLLSLWIEAAVMADVPFLEVRGAFVDVVTDTHYGHAGLAMIAALVLALFIELRLSHARYRLTTSAIAALLVMLVAFARVCVGHAFEHGMFSIPVAVEWIHLVLMSLWVGTVLVSGWVTLPRMRSDVREAGGARANYLAAMSSWATVALAGIAATGLFNTSRVLMSWHDLMETAYGNVLAIKLGLVMIAVALGGWNRWIGLPAVTSVRSAGSPVTRGLNRVIAILRVESFVLLLIVAAAAVLTSSAPPVLK